MNIQLNYCNLLRKPSIAIFFLIGITVVWKNESIVSSTLVIIRRYRETHTIPCMKPNQNSLLELNIIF